MKEIEILRAAVKHFARLIEDDVLLIRNESREAAIAALSEANAALAETAPAPADTYYLQDKRSYVGNCVMWWAKDGRGYTTDLRKAHRYTKEQAERKQAIRDTDIPWPCAAIDPLAAPRVDMQYLPKAKKPTDV